MDTQTYINLLLLAVSCLGSIVLSILGYAMVKIIGDIKELGKSISDLSLLVAGQYITRSEHDKIMGEIFQKLDRLVERQK